MCEEMRVREGVSGLWEVVSIEEGIKLPEFSEIPDRFFVLSWCPRYV